MWPRMPVHLTSSPRPPAPGSKLPAAGCGPGRSATALGRPYPHDWAEVSTAGSHSTDLRGPVVVEVGAAAVLDEGRRAARKGAVARSRKSAAGWRPRPSACVRRRTARSWSGAAAGRRSGPACGPSRRRGGRCGAVAGRERSGPRVRPIRTRRADRHDPPPRPRPAWDDGTVPRWRWTRVGVLGARGPRGVSRRRASRGPRAASCSVPTSLRSRRPSRGGAGRTRCRRWVTPAPRDALRTRVARPRRFPHRGSRSRADAAGPGAADPLAGPRPHRAGLGAGQDRAAPGRSARRGGPTAGTRVSAEKARAYFRHRRDECLDRPRVALGRPVPDLPAAGCPAPRTGPPRCAHRSPPRCRGRAARRA